MNKIKYIKPISLFILLCCAILFVLPANAIKIGLYTNANEVTIGSYKGGMIADLQSGQGIMTLSAMKPYKLTKYGNGFKIYSNGKQYQINSSYITIKPSGSDNMLFAKKGWYRGYFLAYNTGNGIILINDVDIESYIRGVVPSEMPARWNPEALKAQAIASRSYAIANLGKRSKYGFDLKDTTEDQVYKGASAETVKTNELVQATRGQVLVYGNKVIPAYYHSSSGGQTLPSGQVWGKNLPFVRPVVAFDSNVPKNGHGIGMSQYGANYLANYGYNAYQILGYFYQNVKLYSIQY